MKYLIEKKENEVKFKRITLNAEEYGDNLVELTDEELDQQLKDYSQQGLYVSTYFQYKTQRHGIEFRRFTFTTDFRRMENKCYNWKPTNIPDDEPLSGEECYSIKPNLVDLEVSLLTHYYDYPYSKKYIKYLTKTEFADIAREYLKSGRKVNIGRYQRKKKKWEFIIVRTIKEVKDNGEIIYYPYIF